MGLNVLLYWHCKLHRLTSRLSLEHMSNVNTAANIKLFPQVPKYSPSPIILQYKTCTEPHGAFGVVQQS